MFPAGGSTMTFVSPMGQSSFIFQSNGTYWKVHLNDQEQTYIGYLRKTQLQKWQFRRYWKCIYDSDNPFFKEIYTIVYYLNRNYRELEQTTYRHKCRRCNKKLTQQQRRQLGIGFHCQKQEELQEANRREQQRTEHQTQREREEGRRREATSEQHNQRRMDIDSD